MHAGVAVIGAGVTGLTTAYLLLSRGVTVRVFEASSGVGGLAGTFVDDGFHFDFGPHEFCTDNPELRGLLAELCGDDLLRVEKRCSQYLSGRFIRYPFGVADVLRSFPAGTTARILGEVAWAQVRRLFKRPVDRSFSDWTRNRFGKTLFRSYFGPYTEKVWGVDPDQLDADAAAQRIAASSLGELLEKTVLHRLRRRRRGAETHDEFQHEFLYTRGGMGTLQQHLRRRVEEMGGQIVFGKRLRGIRSDGERIVDLQFEDGSAVHGVSHVISTIPLPAMVGMALGDEASALLAANRLPFRGMVFVFLRVGKERVTNDHWTYFPDPEVGFQRLTEFGHFGADMCPAGATAVALEVPATPGDAIWKLPDERIANDCIATLQKLELLQPGDVLGFSVVRQSHAYPVLVRGFAAKADALLSSLERFTNLVSLGRQGVFRYCNQDECMEMAMSAVPEILAGKSSIRYTGAGNWRGVGAPQTVRTD